MIESGLRRGDNSAAPRRGDTEAMLARGSRAQYSGDMSLAFDIVGASFSLQRKREWRNAEIRRCG